MKHKLTILFTLIATPLVLAKLIDVHIPCKEELYMEYTKERDRENREAFDTLKDKNATEEERTEAQHTLMDNGAMV